MPLVSLRAGLAMLSVLLVAVACGSGWPIGFAQAQMPPRTDPLGDVDPFGDPAEDDPFGDRPAEDPFGGGPVPGADPFGGDAPESDPFGEEPTGDEAVPAAVADDDPFSDYVPDTEEARRQKESELKKRLIERSAEYVRGSFQSSDVQRRDDVVLQHGLACLHYQRSLATAQPSAMETMAIFERFARQQWQTSADEPAKTIVARLRETLAREGVPRVEGCAFDCDELQLRKKYDSLSKEPWPLDWTSDEKHWASVAETFFESWSAADPAVAWKAIAARDKANHAFYAAAYLGVLRVRAAQPDTELIDAFVADADSAQEHAAAERVVRLALALSAVSGRELPGKRPVQSRLREKLLLEVSAIDEAELIRTLSVLGDTYQRVPETEMKPVLQSVLQRPQTYLFCKLCQQAKIRPASMYEHFVAKQCRIKPAKFTPDELFGALRRQVEVPLWIDDSLADDDRKFAFSAAGSWLEVVEQAAAASGVEVALFDDWVLWVGPARNRAAAEALLRNSRAKLAGDDGPAEATAQRMGKACSVEFAETPLQDICDYLRDAHGIEVTSWGSGSEATPVTLQTRELPLHLTLSLLCQQHGLDWQTAHGTVVVGRRDWTAALRRTGDQYRLAKLHRAAREDSVAHALVDTTTLEFIETPLQDVADYLTDLHGVPCVVDDGLSDLAITANLRGDELAWALSRICHEKEIAWHDDVDAIYFCKPERLTIFQQRSAKLKALRTTYSKSLAAKLMKPIPQIDADTYLTDAVEHYQASSGVTIEIDDEIEQAARVSRHLSTAMELPLDLQLTVMAEANDIRWLVDRNKIIIAPKSPMQNEH